MAIVNNKVQIEVEVVGIQQSQNKIEKIQESTLDLKDGVKGVGESFKSLGDIAEKSGGMMGGAFGSLGEGVLALTESVGAFRDGVEVAGKSGARSWLLMLGPLAAVAGGVALLIEAYREFSGAAKEAEALEAAMGATAGELTAIYEEFAENGVQLSTGTMREFITTTIEGRMALELLNEQTANMTQKFASLISSQKLVQKSQEEYNKALAEAENKEETVADRARANMFGFSELTKARSALTLATSLQTKAEQEAAKAIEQIAKEYEFIQPLLEKQIEARRVMNLQYDDVLNNYESELKSLEALRIKENQLIGTADSKKEAIELLTYAESTLDNKRKEHALQLKDLEKLGLADNELNKKKNDLIKKQALELDNLTEEMKKSNTELRRTTELQEAKQKKDEATSETAKKATETTRLATSSAVDFFTRTREEFKNTLDFIDRQYNVLKESQIRISGGLKSFAEKNQMELERQFYNLKAYMGELETSFGSQITSFEQAGESFKKLQDQEVFKVSDEKEIELIKTKITQLKDLKERLLDLKKTQEEQNLQFNEGTYQFVDEQKYTQTIQSIQYVDSTLKKLQGDLTKPQGIFKDINDWYSEFFLKNLSIDINAFRASKAKDFNDQVLSVFKLNPASTQSILKSYDDLFEDFKFRVDENLTVLSEYNVDRLNTLKDALQAPGFANLGITKANIENLTNFNDAISLILSKSTDKNRGAIKEMILGLFPGEPESEASDKALYKARSRADELLTLLSQIPKATGKEAVKAYQEAYLLEEQYLNKMSDTFLKFNEEQRASIKDIIKSQMDERLKAYQTTLNEETKALEEQYIKEAYIEEQRIASIKQNAIKEAGFRQEAKIAYIENGKELSLSLDEYDARMAILATQREQDKNQKLLELQRKQQEASLQLLEDFTNETGDLGGDMLGQQSRAILGLNDPRASKRRHDAYNAMKKDILSGYEAQLDIARTKEEELTRVEEQALRERNDLNRQYADLRYQQSEKDYIHLASLVKDNLAQIYESNVQSLSANLANALFSTEFEDKQRELESNRKQAMKEYQGDVNAQIDIERQYRAIKAQIAKEEENAVSNLLKAQLKAMAIEATQRAAFNTAMGLGALALGPIGGTSAADWFASAAVFAGVGATAGLASTAVGNPTSSNASTSISPTGSNQSISPNSTREDAQKTEPVVFNINFAGANIYDSRQAALRALSDEIAQVQAQRRGGYRIEIR